MNRKRSVLFQIIIIVFIFAVIYLASILNSFAFRSNAVDAGAENTAAVLEMVMERSEYGLKYGRELENYYDIDTVFEDISKYCETEKAFITDTAGAGLYGEEPPEDITDRIAQLTQSGDNTYIYESDKDQYILHAISGKETIEGYVGIHYPTERTGSISAPYERRILISALIASVAGALIFELLFCFIKHRYDRKKLRIIVVATLIAVSVGMIISTYSVLKSGYTYLAEDVCERVLEQNRSNIDNLIENGIRYSDIDDAAGYYKRISDRSEQIDSLRLSRVPDKSGACIKLDTDDSGEEYYLISAVSKEYIRNKINSALLNVIVTIVTALMLSAEVIGFLVDILTGEAKNRRAMVDNSAHKTIESIGVVRGISFFFASFRFMAVAFMSIVLAQIYEPVAVFGYTIPKEILMSLPMSAQVFISMITSYLSGKVVNKRGWKPVTIAGIAVMIAGTAASAFATKPVPFIIAQMIMGIGLGFAKMGIDIYSIVVSSETDMTKYTAGANAAIIVGYSCSASIGALIASTFGYSGAYIVMGLIGISVLVIMLIFGMNVAPRSEVAEEAAEDVIEWNHKGPDIRFGAYILCVIVPYYFIMMFVDYFFPVYSNSVGITTDIIGVVMMINGIGTAYLGAVLCPKLSSKYSPAHLMPVLLVILSGVILVFAFKNMVIFAVLVVFMIGTADGIMPSIQFEYLYKLPFAKRRGFSNALGIEGFFSNLIGAIAPIIFGIVMIYGSGGLAIVSIAVFALAAVFWIVNGRGRAKASVSVIIVAGLLTYLAASASGKENDNPGSDTLRIGYCQDGDYYEFDYEIYQIGKGLAENGQLFSEKLNSLKQGDKASDVWDALSKADSECFTFVPEAYFDIAADGFIQTDEDGVKRILADGIREYDIDLMITMGTSAGCAVRDACSVPYMNFIASDPIESKITGGEEFSGSDRAWAHVSTGVEQRALTVMEDIFGARSVGIVYNNTEDAYIYSGAASVDEFAKTNRIKVMRQYVRDYEDYSAEAYEAYKREMLAAHRKLADSGIDLYILTTTGLEADDFYECLEPFMDKGIPVFSLNSTEDVRFGALAAVEMFDYENIGRFAAANLNDFYNGTGLSEIPQVYETAPFLVINSDTLHQTGVKMSLDALLSASTIYPKYMGE